MDWVKVVKALDDAWWSRTEAANRTRAAGRDDAMARQNSAIAFMLRDCLIVGLSPEDRKRYDELSRS